jgi:hypothetical protein
MVTKKVVRGEGMREGAGVGIPVFLFSRITVLRAGVGEELGNPVVRFSSVPVEVGLEEEVETEASEKEMASLSREMKLPGMVAIT